MPGNPNIYVDVHSRVVDRDVDRAAAGLTARYQRIGAGSGESFAKGFKGASPKLQEAFEKMGRAADKFGIEEKKVLGIRREAEQQAARMAAAEKEVASSYTAVQAAARRRADGEREVEKLRSAAPAGLGRQTAATQIQIGPRRGSPSVTGMNRTPSTTLSGT